MLWALGFGPCLRSHCASRILLIIHMHGRRTSARWIRFAVGLALALGLAVASGAAQRFTIMTNGQNLQRPINHGLPDKQLGFTFCRLRYENIRRARKSGWGDDYPQADYNFLVRLAELTTTTISRWDNGYPGFANVTATDSDLFGCPYLRMQNAANYDFTPEETARMHDYLLKGGFLWIDDNWDPDFEYIRPNLMRILPGAKIVDLPVEHPMFSVLYRVNPLPQIPSLGSWQRTRQDSEIGPSTVHRRGDRGRRVRTDLLQATEGKSQSSTLSLTRRNLRRLSKPPRGIAPPCTRRPTRIARP